MFLNYSMFMDFSFHCYLTCATGTKVNLKSQYIVPKSRIMNGKTIDIDSNKTPVLMMRSNFRSHYFPIHFIECLVTKSLRVLSIHLYVHLNSMRIKYRTYTYDRYNHQWNTFIIF